MLSMLKYESVCEGLLRVAMWICRLIAWLAGITHNSDNVAEGSTLLSGLPDDVVVQNVWPRLIRMSSAQDICQYRVISTHWRALVGSSWQWRALQPMLVGIDPQPLWYEHGISLDELLYTPEYLRCEYNRPQHMIEEM